MNILKSGSCIIYVTPDKPSTPYCEKSANKSITLKWNAVDGASGYILYQKKGNNWNVIKETTATTFKVNKLKPGTKYQFKVKAYVNADGQKYSVDSDVAKIATTPKKISINSIKKVRNKKTMYGTYYKMKLKWKKASGATGYRVYYKMPGSSYKTFYKEFKKNSATVELYRGKAVKGSKKYTFYVVPIIEYEGRTYIGAYSKGKAYKLH